MKQILGFIIGLVAGMGLGHALRGILEERGDNVIDANWHVDMELEEAEIGVKQRAFSSYLVARGQLTAFPESPGYAGLVDVASTLALDTESIRGARDELYRVFPAHIAEAVERMLTGDIWTEDMGWPAGGRSS